MNREVLPFGDGENRRGNILRFGTMQPRHMPKIGQAPISKSDGGGRPSLSDFINSFHIENILRECANPKKAYTDELGVARSK